MVTLRLARCFVYRFCHAASLRPRPISRLGAIADGLITLLLPRGINEGMEFRLFVMFSQGDDMALPPEHAEHCTSVSYCGLQDEEYPDKQDMGYPFSRPFQDGISSTVVNHDNMAWRTIKIRCRNL